MIILALTYTRCRDRLVNVYYTLRREMKGLGLRNGQCVTGVCTGTLVTDPRPQLFNAIYRLVFVFQLQGR